MTKLTAEAVTQIAGNMETGRVLEILKTGATQEELVEALEWLSADDAMSSLRHHAPSDRVAKLRDILGRDEIDTDEEHRAPAPEGE